MFDQDRVANTESQINEIDGEISCMAIKLLYVSKLALRFASCFLFLDFTRIIDGGKLSDNEKVIAKASFVTSCHYKRCIAFDYNCDAN